MKREARCAIRGSGSNAASQFLLDQHRGSLAALAVLQRKQSQDMRGGSFQFRYELLRSAAKECVEHHRWNTDRQPGGRVNKRLTDPTGERHVTRRSDVSSKRAERMDNSKHRPQEAEQRRDHSYVREVNDAVVQTGRNAGALCLSDFADL